MLRPSCLRYALLALLRVSPQKQGEGVVQEQWNDLLSTLHISIIYIENLLTQAIQAVLYRDEVDARSKLYTGMHVQNLLPTSFYRVWTSGSSSGSWTP